MALLPGDKVTYKTDYRMQHGIVKSQSVTDGFVFVVYSCGGNWEDYENYTGELTNNIDLVEGWIDLQ